MKHSYWFMALELLWKELRVPFYMLFITLAGGALGYKLLYPDEAWYHVFYMTAITLATVGYSDILGTDQSPLTAFYTMILMLVGMGMVVYAVSSVTAFFVGGNLTELINITTRKRKIYNMRDHYIVCGAGSTGVHVINEMRTCEVPVVVIEQDEDRIKTLKKHFPDLLFLIGDANQEELLEEARIHDAKGLVASLHNDKENLFLTLTARLMNPTMKIVCKTIDLSIRRRLETAGADYIVSPNFIGGMRMASEILRPNVVTFLDRMLRGQEANMRVGEVSIPPESHAVGKSLAYLEIYRNTGLNILAYSHSGKEEDYRYNPGLDLKLSANGVLLFVGTPQQQQQLQDIVS